MLSFLANLTTMLKQGKVYTITYFVGASQSKQLRLGVRFAFITFLIFSFSIGYLTYKYMGLQGELAQLKSNYKITTAEKEILEKRLDRAVSTSNYASEFKSKLNAIVQNSLQEKPNKKATPNKRESVNEVSMAAKAVAEIVAIKSAPVSIVESEGSLRTQPKNDFSSIVLEEVFSSPLPLELQRVEFSQGSPGTMSMSYYVKNLITGRIKGGISASLSYYTKQGSVRKIALPEKSKLIGNYVTGLSYKFSIKNFLDRKLNFNTPADFSRPSHLYFTVKSDVCFDSDVKHKACDIPTAYKTYKVSFRDGDRSRHAGRGETSP